MKNRTETDPLTGEIILLTPNRLDRPNARIDRELSGVCPFCPGHEDETPPEIERVEDANDWLIRVVPNKFPITTPAIDGIHEVIVESPRHEEELRLMDSHHLQRLIEVWVRRLSIARAAPGVRSAVLFRNRGVNAGESIPHPHSQMIGLPFVPARIESQCGEADTCPICQVDESLVIEEATGFRLVAAPFARYPYQTRIVPRDHVPRPVAGDFSSSTLTALLQESERLLHEELGEVSINWHVCEAPVDRNDFHWYVEISPRITGVAGLEIATGVFVNLVPPEECAVALKKRRSKAGR